MDTPNVKYVIQSKRYRFNYEQYESDWADEKKFPACPLLPDAIKLLRERDIEDFHDDTQFQIIKRTEEIAYKE